MKIEFISLVTLISAIFAIIFRQRENIKMYSLFTTCKIIKFFIPEQFTLKNKNKQKSLKQFSNLFH